MKSDAFSIRSSIAKTEYWKYFADQLRVQVTGDSVQIGGRSGFYVPPPASAVTRLARKLTRAVRHPSEVGTWIGREIGRRFEVPRLMSTEKAFDAVMSSSDVAMA